MKKVPVTVKRSLRLSLHPDTLAHDGPIMSLGTTGLAVQTVSNENGSQVTLVMPVTGGLGWVAVHELVEVAAR